MASQSSNAEPPFKKPRIDTSTNVLRVLRVTELAQSHAKEIRALTESVKLKDKTRAISQALPHYMRRRAASHNINRLPRKVIEKLKSQNQPLPPTKKKKPSRYHKRRPKNLLDEYNRRQRRVHWLETHIWHAKRYHMVEKWGHKLAESPTDRSERAGYRAATSHCMITDQSYYYCYEISGPKSIVNDKVNLLVPYKKLNSEILNGMKTGSCVLYKPNEYPKGAIGPVEIMCNPSCQHESQSQVWIWSHISLHDYVKQVLRQMFEVDADIDEVSGKSSDGLVTVTSLKDSLLRFSLDGKETGEVLCRVISPCSTSPKAEGKHVWWKDYTNREKEVTDRLDFLRPQPAEDDNCILSVRARDPRLCMPYIQSPNRKETTESWYGKLQAEGDEKNFSVSYRKVTQQGWSCFILTTCLYWQSQQMKCVSPLWAEQVRSTVSTHMTSQKELNAERQKLLVPGSDLHMGDAENVVPLIITRYSARANVILPANWGMAFWLAFTYAGARAGGLRESAMIEYETGRLRCPSDFPDTECCREEEESTAKTLTEKHYKYPPGKRPNYDKLGTNSPFQPEWTNILDGEQPVVLRDTRLIDELIQACKGSGTSVVTIDESLSEVNLVAVRISMVNRGKPTDRDEIYIPNDSDIAGLTSDDAKYGLEQTIYQGEPKARNEYYSTLAGDRLRTSRQIIGYVKCGRYTHRLGTTTGVGFITLKSLLTLLSDSKFKMDKNGCKGLLCLIRPGDSRQYRYAVLSIAV